MIEFAGFIYLISNIHSPGFKYTTVRTKILGQQLVRQILRVSESHLMIEIRNQYGLQLGTENYVPMEWIIAIECYRRS